jgi:hypothetical protein
MSLKYKIPGSKPRDYFYLEYKARSFHLLSVISGPGLSIPPTTGLFVHDRNANPAAPFRLLYRQCLLPSDLVFQTAGGFILPTFKDCSLIFPL